ncbi:Crp/Fnr family transcriptional regulator [Acaryochloris sp. IP29b_bin.148]|uniref:Crp/Fnr family transcriptional regulator n=1 Tax=Acaryochloris sp. IP29b_bin.148 TaxID=2969218 RepID=UPI0026306A44|nr:Crp/Fnr family transcriptional regulator [Acaryochloris sp. IP29b_bin.148]
MTALHATSTCSLPHLALKPREILPHESSDYLWRVEQGLVRTCTWDEDGDLVTLGLWGPGDCIGRRFSNMTPFEMESLCNVEVQAIPVFNQDLVEVMRSHIRCMETLFRINSYKRSPQRLLIFLQWLSNRFGQPVKHGQLIDLGLTHQLFAEITGINRITATRLLNELERAGKIKQLPKQRIILPSPTS